MAIIRECDYADLMYRAVRQVVTLATVFKTKKNLNSDLIDEIHAAGDAAIDVLEGHIEWFYRRYSKFCIDTVAIKAQGDRLKVSVPA